VIPRRRLRPARSEAREQVAQAAETTAAPRPEPAGSSPVEARIEELHKKLHITDAQKPQWDAVAQVMRENAQAIVDLEKQRATDVQSMTAVDVVKSYESVIEAHEAGIKKFITAFEALYDSMSEEQKKIADSLFRSRARTAAKKESM
jgi:periplasmic protein CpxP/Spy